VSGPSCSGITFDASGVTAATALSAAESADSALRRALLHPVAIPTATITLIQLLMLRM
jgi:hypothetical protein